MTRQRGRKTGLSAQQIAERNRAIVARVRAGEKVTEVAEEFDVSKWMVYKILPEDVERPGGQGEYDRGRAEEKRRARELRAQGMTYRQIAEELGVAKSSAYALAQDD